MRGGILVLGLLVGGLAACGAPPVPPAPDAAGAPPVYRLQGDAPDPQLVLRDATATSTGLWQGSYYVAGRAIDGNTDTEWGSTTVDPAPALTCQLDPSWVTRLRIKTWPGSRFVIELSPDGTTWSTTDTRNSTSWNMEPQPVGASGRYLRIRFVDGPPPGALHRSVFEIEAYGLAQGGGGGGGDATEGRLYFLGTSQDRVGSGAQTTPNGYPDGRLRFSLELDAPSEIRAFDLEEVTRGTRNPTGAHWSTRNAGNWILGVLSPGGDILGFRSTLGTYGAGRHTFDLYAENTGAVFTGGGNEARLTVDFAGTTRAFFVPLPN